MDAYMGLSSAEAEKRLEEYGPNSLPRVRFKLLRLILRQFKGIFNVLLIVASIITFLLGEPTDSIFILVFIILGMTLNVFQEYKSNAAAEKLQSYLVHTITVLRDGKELEIPTDVLVPGDLLKLEAGDIVPADSLILEAWELLVDETTFTGESLPVSKFPPSDKESNSQEAHLLLQGVIIVRGNALAKVTATGINTKFARLASAATSIHSESELVKGVDRISKFILKATTITLVLIIFANILVDGGNADLPQLLIFAIALAVSVIPEALPLVLTFSLSRGALKFAKNHVLVKRLSSVQDLGSVNLLCTDKTGTITENKLVKANSLPLKASGYDPILLARLAAVSLDKRVPEPFDKALEECLSEEQKSSVKKYKIILEEAFDPALRSNGVIVEDDIGHKLHLRRGSPDCFMNLEKKEIKEIQDWIKEEESKGHRILGVSYDEGMGMIFSGLVSFVDTLKATTIETVEAARNLNVAITIITGDARMVAEAVGREAGLVTESEQVADAKTFLSLPIEAQQERIGNIRVFARTTPEQKLEIIQKLKAKHTVAYLGEGINDAPALKAAHVSLVVQSASDVAREMADIVLLKNDLRVIVEGIRLGRETHANTMKYIRATLISNFGNFYAVAISTLFITFLPMLPKQLLLLNLLSDVPMILIAFDKVGEEEVKQPQRYDFHSLYITFITLGLVSTVFDFIYFALFFRISPEVLQTNWFMASVLTELLLILSIRSMLPIHKSGMPAIGILLLSSVALILTLVIPMIPATAEFFGFVRPTSEHLFLILGLAILYLIATELAKRPIARFTNSKRNI